MALWPKFLDWFDIEHYIDNIVATIACKGEKFDTIVCMGRGGMIPSRILADELDVHDIFPIMFRSYTGVGERGEIECHEFQYDLSGRKVLLVDDIVDTGNSIDFVQLKLQQHITMPWLPFAALLVKEKVKQKPDYFGEIIDNQEEWIVFPWEHKEYKREIK